MGIVRIRGSNVYNRVSTVSGIINSQQRKANIKAK